jgi:hypothetical protein
MLSSYRLFSSTHADPDKMPHKNNDGNVVYVAGSASVAAPTRSPQNE